MPRPPLSLSLQFARFDGVAEHRAALPRHRVARWLRAALGDDVQAAELAVRVVGDLLLWMPVRQWGGLLNAIVLLLFLVNTLTAMTAE